MKILHIYRSMGQGGAQKVIFQLCKGFCEKNDIFVASTGGYYVGELKKIDVTHYEIPDIVSNSPIYAVKILVKLYQIIKCNKIKIIHTHHRRAALYAKILSIVLPDIKLVYTSHNVFYDKKRITRFSLSKSKLIAVGESVRENMTNIYKLKNIEVIRNAVEVNVEAANYSNEILKRIQKKNKTVIGFVGRLSAIKGCDLLIKASEILKKRGIFAFYVIIGDGEEKTKLIDFVNSKGLYEQYYFMGFQKNIQGIMKYLDFLVLPSWKEGFPLTPIEAFSMGKTIIASNVPGTTEIVLDEKNGLLFEAGNTEMLASQIERLIYDKDLLNNLEKNAITNYLTLYSYNIFIDKYKKVYEKVR